MRWNPLNTRIGLALGGGAARGIAHVGVLKALEENHIDINCIAGTSVGALVGSYYAFGQPVDQIMSIGSTLNLTKMINLTLKKGGLFSTEAIRQMVRRDLGDRNIEDAEIPLAICATDIETGEQVLFQKGNLEAARKSYQSFGSDACAQLDRAGYARGPDGNSGTLKVEGMIKVWTWQVRRCVVPEPPCSALPLNGLV